MKSTLYLKDGKAKTKTSIYARISINGQPLFKYYLPEKVEPKYWNQKEQKVRRSYTGYSSFNDILSVRLKTIESTYRDYVYNNRKEPTVEVLKGLIDEIIKPKTKESVNKSFFNYYDTFIENCEKGVRLSAKGKPIAKGTINTYKGTLVFLKEYQHKQKRPIDFGTIDLDFYSGFTEFLTKDKLQSTNSIGKHIKNIKAVLNDATERGVNTNLAYKSKLFKRVSEKTDSIYLNEEELEELAAIDLSHKVGHEQVRDLFLVGCYTGLRFSDLSKLTTDNIEGGFIELVQQKTNEPVIIPVHPKVEELLNKYEGELPKAISNQKTNQYLKDIGEDIPTLKRQEKKSFTKGGVGIVKNYKKWQLLTTHTARRSFATNNYLNGVPAITIMAITGHKTEKSFLNYIKVTPKEHAKLIKLSWEKKRNIV